MLRGRCSGDHEATDGEAVRADGEAATIDGAVEAADRTSVLRDGAVERPTGGRERRPVGPVPASGATATSDSRKAPPHGDSESPDGSVEAKHSPVEALHAAVEAIDARVEAIDDPEEAAPALRERMRRGIVPDGADERTDGADVPPVRSMPPQTAAWRQLAARLNNVGGVASWTAAAISLRAVWTWHVTARYEYSAAPTHRRMARSTYLRGLMIDV